MRHVPAPRRQNSDPCSDSDELICQLEITIFWGHPTETDHGSSALHTLVRAPIVLGDAANLSSQHLYESALSGINFVTLDGRREKIQHTVSILGAHSSWIKGFPLRGDPHQPSNLGLCATDAPFSLR